MDVGSIILGRPWLFDVDATIFGKSNSCIFTFEGRKIRINPMEPKPKPTPKIHKATDTHKAIHLVTAKVFEREVKNEPLVFALVAKEYPEMQDVIPPKVPPILEEFQSVFPSDLPESLPPLRDIQHAIDLVPETTLPNLHHYHLNPSKHAYLKRQVDELLSKGFIR